MERVERPEIDLGTQHIRRPCPEFEDEDDDDSNPNQVGSLNEGEVRLPCYGDCQATEDV